VNLLPQAVEVRTGLPRLRRYASVFFVVKKSPDARIVSPYRFPIFLTLALAIAGSAARIAASEKIHIVARYFAGETLFYRVALRVSSKGDMTTPILNPEGATSWNESIRMVVRLDLLSVPAALPTTAQQSNSPNSGGRGAGAEAGALRVRATFKESDATVETDAVNPAEPSPGNAYKELASHSIELTMVPSGQLAHVTGLAALDSKTMTQHVSFEWLGAIIARSNLPNRWISMGEKWSTERALTGMPLSNMIWRAGTSYVRDDPCGPEAVANPPASASESRRDTCAVILTRFEITRKGSPHEDATPEDYVQNGLRTMGKWSGSGESMDSISIASGQLVSSTQSSTQDTDYTITSATTGSKIHQVGHMTTETEITLLAPEGPKT